MQRFLYILFALSIILLIMQQLFAWNYFKTFSKKEIEACFKPITSKYGIKIVYEIEEDFFSPLVNPPMPAGPPRYSKVKPIRHRVLMEYPHFLQTAFGKYPIAVIKKHLNAIYFAREIDAKGFKFGGSYDPFRRIIYLVDNGKSGNEAMGTLHHEFSSLLLKSHSFWVDRWTDHNPMNFKYLAEKYQSWKTLEQEMDISKEGTQQDYKKGFVSIYGQTNFENDFNEFSEMIFTYPEKFKKIMNQYPRIRGKFLVWLKFYKSIDPIFTEEYLFGKSVNAAK